MTSLSVYTCHISSINIVAMQPKHWHGDVRLAARLLSGCLITRPAAPPLPLKRTGSCARCDEGREDGREEGGRDEREKGRTKGRDRGRAGGRKEEREGGSWEGGRDRGEEEGRKEGRRRKREGKGRNKSKGDRGKMDKR